MPFSVPLVMKAYNSIPSARYTLEKMKRKEKTPQLYIMTSLLARKGNDTDVMSSGYKKNEK